MLLWRSADPQGLARSPWPVIGSWPRLSVGTKAVGEGEGDGPYNYCWKWIWQVGLLAHKETISCHRITLAILLSSLRKNTNCVHSWQTFSSFVVYACALGVCIGVCTGGSSRSTFMRRLFPVNLCNSLAPVLLEWLNMADGSADGWVSFVMQIFRFGNHFVDCIELLCMKPSNDTSAVSFFVVHGQRTVEVTSRNLKCGWKRTTLDSAWWAKDRRLFEDLTCRKMAVVTDYILLEVMKIFAFGFLWAYDSLYYKEVSISEDCSFVFMVVKCRIPEFISTRFLTPQCLQDHGYQYY